MTNGGVTLETLVAVTNTNLRAIEMQIVEAVAANLERKVAGDWNEGDDALFGPLTAFVVAAWRVQWHRRAIRMWLVELVPIVENAEAQLGARIHKGSPIYNTGLCFFMAGDLARAMQYTAAAAEEDEATHGGCSRLLEGGGLGEQVLLSPLFAWLEAEFGADYAAATGKRFSSDEVKELVGFLSQRQPDAVLFIMALHRYSTQVKGPDNAASRLQRVRAFADLLLVFESSLRQWQSMTGRAELFRRATDLLGPNPAASAEFSARGGAYRGVDWEKSTVVDAMVRGEEGRFAAARTVAQKAAVAVFVSYRLRNSVMHVLDDQLELFAKPELLKKVLGFALIALRLSRAGAEGQIANL
jgi:hypothetical protein